MAKLHELADAGVDQFNFYLMNGDEEDQLERYGREVIPALSPHRRAAPEPDRCRIRRIGWFGTRTDRYDETVEFFSSVLGLRFDRAEPDFAMFTLPDADRDFVEVFGPSQSDDWPAPGVSSGVGFVVDDIVRGARRS